MITHYIKAKKAVVRAIVQKNAIYSQYVIGNSNLYLSIILQSNI
jgi:hypothetical protein